MIFSELYGAYYNTAAAILKAAADHPLGKGELKQIIGKTAFGESVLNILPAVEEERWQLIRRDGTTPIAHIPSMPLTTLEKRWLKAISLDPRMRLFSDELPDLSDVEPLFTPDDFRVFDRYGDGDPYEDEGYIARFRLILDAVRNRYPLHVNTVSRHGVQTHYVLMPEYLEYSEKDDKFRLYSSGNRYGRTINLGRIVSVKPYQKPFAVPENVTLRRKHECVVFELTDERNALERVMLHFAHFEKEAEKLDEGRYRVKLVYEKEDETELVIRILSFGPRVKAVSPDGFVDLIKERLTKQMAADREN